MIKTLIVDDEPLALQVLETHIEKLPEVQLIAKCENAIEANKILNENQVDLICLDIKMPQISGIEFLKSLKNPPMVIFTTAFSSYAVEGFELDVIDYLVKPISFERFLKAINKVQERMRNNHKDNYEEDDYFYVKADKKLIKIKYDDILYIEGLKDYVIIKTTSGRVVTLQTMKSLDEKLSEHNFRRVHRSFIVNIDKINSIMGNMIEIKDKNKEKLIPIGKNYREELLHMIEDKRL